MGYLSADDVNVYKAWLRHTVAVYSGLVLLGATAVATLAVTNGPTAVSYLTTAIALALASP
jgi:hypothetical protein